MSPPRAGFFYSYNFSSLAANISAAAVELEEEVIMHLLCSSGSLCCSVRQPTCGLLSSHPNCAQPIVCVSLRRLPSAGEARCKVTAARMLLGRTAPFEVKQANADPHPSLPAQYQGAPVYVIGHSMAAAMATLCSRGCR